jgi:hypothetical protein
MNNSEYEKQNYVKASFDAGYIAPTPHLYFHNMSAVNYRMAEYMNPFLAALVEASVRPPPEARQSLGSGVLLWGVWRTAEDRLLVSGLGGICSPRDKFRLLVVRR